MQLTDVHKLRGTMSGDVIDQQGEKLTQDKKKMYLKMFQNTVRWQC